jgi:Na+/melibiose symporter-like transporter
MVKYLKDPNRAYVTCIVLCAGLYGVFWLLPNMFGIEWARSAMNYGPLFWLFALCGLFQGAYYQFVWILLPGAVDYGIWKYNRNQSGFIYSLCGFCLTFGGSFGAAVIGFALGRIGYAEGITFTDTLRNNLFLISVLIPSVIAIAHAFMQSFYGMSEKQHVKILEEIRAKTSA